MLELSRWCWTPWVGGATIKLSVGVRPRVWRLCIIFVENLWQQVKLMDITRHCSVKFPAVLKSSVVNVALRRTSITADQRICFDNWNKTPTLTEIFSQLSLDDTRILCEISYTCWGTCLSPRCCNAALGLWAWKPVICFCVCCYFSPPRVLSTLICMGKLHWDFRALLMATNSISTRFL